MMLASMELLFLLLTLIVLSRTSQSTPSNAKDVGNYHQTVGNIAFDLADLTVTMPVPSGGEYHIDAFKSSKNDEILSRLDASRVSQVFWVSVGKPTLVKTLALTAELDGQSPPVSSMRYFHYNLEGFYTFVEMLTPFQRQLLADRASAKYGVNISNFQIANLPLSSFECSVKVEDYMGNQHPLVGRVTDFRTFPLRLDFKAPHHSVGRRLFQERLGSARSEEDADLMFACRLQSQGHIVKTNTLTIELQQLERLGILDKLFGPTSSNSDSSSAGTGQLHTTNTIHVTRDQLTALSADLYSRLNIFENYEIPESQFSEDFVKDLIMQVAVGHFSPVPIDEALHTLSSYAFDFDDDLQADKVKLDLGSLLVIQRLDEKKRIVLNDTMYDDLERQVDVQRGGNKARRLGVEGTARWARNNERGSLAAETRTLMDQLNELNTVSYTDTKWMLDGERIVPKSLNVIKFRRSNIGRELTFSRVKRHTIVAPFDNPFTLYTRNMVRSWTSPPRAVSSTDTTSKQCNSSHTADDENHKILSLATVLERLDDLRLEWRGAIVDVARSIQQLNDDVKHQVNRTLKGDCGPTTSSRQVPDVRPNQPSVVTSPRRLTSVVTSSPLPEGRCVWGIAIFNGRLYVGRALSRELEVYDSHSLTLQRRLPVSGLGCINDMASRPGAVVMYIADNCHDLIHVVDDTGVRRRWSVVGTPLSVSVTLVGSNALVTFEEAGVGLLREYTPEGDIVREIRLQSGMETPTHAVQLTSSHFAVSQGAHGPGKLHRVSIIDERGTSLMSFGREEGSGVNRTRIPLRLATMFGSLFVVDSQNDRVILLNATSLAYIRQVISEPTRTEFLIRVTLSEDGGRLFVAHNNFRVGLCLTGHVKTYNLTWV